MTINCKNEKCEKEFQLKIDNLEIECNSSGNHTTQCLATGNIYCPHCNHEMEIEYLFDELNDTGEILSKEISSLT